MKKRILIVDDDPAILDILQVLMDAEGFETAVAEKTDDIFSLVRLHEPSLIVIDFLLDGINGGEWCDQLKKDSQYANIPVILFTACSKAITKGSYGCDDFIAKPFDIDDFVERVKTLSFRDLRFADSD